MTEPQITLNDLADYTLLITDRNLVPVGDPVCCWTQLDATLRFNEPASGFFTSPGLPWVRQQISPGNRVVVIRNGDVFTAGPIESSNFERSDDGENAGLGNIRVNFTDDLMWAAGRLAYPDPDVAPALQVIDNWTFSGNAELAIRELVDASAGPSARSERRVPQLVLGSLASVGSTIDAKAALFEPVLDVVRRMALAGGGLGVRTRQVGDQILVETYDPPDVSGTVRFGFEWGNAKYLAYEMNGPTVTAALVGGQGDGADRLVIERTNAAAEAAWGRIERLVSRPGSSPTAELEEAGDQELAEGAETARIPANVADTPDMRYGQHYTLGSVVAQETYPGEQVIDIVRSVHLQAWATAGEIFAPVVGSQAATADPVSVRRLRAMDRRIGRLERTTSSV